MLRGRAAVVTATLMLCASCVDGVAAQTRPAGLPFELGEELEYRASSGRFGKFGRATMRVDGVEKIRGREALVLAFDFSGRVLLFGASDKTRSWLDPDAMASLRYTKRERSPISKKDEAVEVYLSEGRWTGQNGKAGELLATNPLDELSYLYYIRTLPLEPGATYEGDRHYDAERNPVRVVVVGREEVEVEAGVYETIVVELQVTDDGRFGGKGSVRMHVTDDDRHVPVRIQTSMPVAGTVTLDLVACRIARVGEDSGSRYGTGGGDAESGAVGGA